MNQRDEKSLAFRKWIFSALMVGAAVLLSPMFSFPLGVTRAFPLQHMINIFLAVLCGTRYSTSAAFSTALIRNLLGTGSLLAFRGPWWGLSFRGSSTATSISSGQRCWGNSWEPPSSAASCLIYPIAALFMGSSKGALFYVSLFSVSCGAGCIIAFIVLKGIHVIQTEFTKE